MAAGTAAGMAAGTAAGMAVGMAAGMAVGMAVGMASRIASVIREKLPGSGPPRCPRTHTRPGASANRGPQILARKRRTTTLSDTSPTVTTVHELTAAQARRIAVRAQLLDADRPGDLFELVRHLTILQHDQTAAVAPNAELVAWSRLGSACGYGTVAEAVDALELIDLHGLLRPPEDLALFRREMAEWPGVANLPAYLEGQARWVRANEGFRRDILDALRRDGPLISQELPDTCTVSWKSSGWNNNRNVAMMLEMLVERGEVAVAGLRG